MSCPQSARVHRRILRELASKVRIERSGDRVAISIGVADSFVTVLLTTEEVEAVCFTLRKRLAGY